MPPLQDKVLHRHSVLVQGSVQRLALAQDYWVAQDLMSLESVQGYFEEQVPGSAVLELAYVLEWCSIVDQRSER